MLQMSEHHVLSDGEFKRIGQAVYDYCGINLNEDKKELVRSRLMRLLTTHGCTSYGQYLDQVMKDKSGDRLTEMINRISTNLTSFFREEHHFNFLKETFLSRHKTGPAPRIRAWSAGCSSGEEPYSIAISIAETLPVSQRANIRLLASDISTRVLSVAKKGCYHQDRVNGIDSAMRKKYFSTETKSGDGMFKVSPELRKMLMFKRINLMEKWPVSTPLDFIFCRNVMIYFDRETKERLIQRFSNQLKPGGFLFIGHSESLSNIAHDLKYVGPTIYEKK